MSFLNPVRLAFSGTFQADVSTVNNDVRHFDDAGFRPEYQDRQVRPVLNGWWNPTGSNAFRLIDCKVTGVWYDDGSHSGDPTEDCVVGMMIGGSAGRVSGKLVDIDPQWQMASAPWGLEMRLTDGKTDFFVGGRYKPLASRDLWFTRKEGKQGDGAASATFQSVLSPYSWESAGPGGDSRFLREMHVACESSKQFSVRLATFDYEGNAASPRFTFGTVWGAIGPRQCGEPESFVLGRRFTPAHGEASWNGIGFFNGLVHHQPASLLLDLSSALPIDRHGRPADIGEMAAGILLDPATPENTRVTAATFMIIAMVPYRETGWLDAGGILSVPLTEEQVDLAKDHPLALVATSPYDPNKAGFDFGHGIVAIRESAGGMFVGAEPAVHRIDAGETSSCTVYASRYGTPCAGIRVHVEHVGRVPGQGGGEDKDPSPPKASVPDIGLPVDRLHLSDAVVTTGPDGTAVVTIGNDPLGPERPRAYLDGQIYLVDYRLDGQSDSDRQPFDYLVVHARDAVGGVDSPAWSDIAPIVTQYANLYPSMSRVLINLADPADWRQHRDILRFALLADMEDPDHMPVTRDLSRAKRDLVIRWLDLGAPGPAGPPPEAPREVAVVGEIEEDPGSKTHFAAGFRKAMGGRRRP